MVGLAAVEAIGRERPALDLRGGSRPGRRLLCSARDPRHRHCCS